MRNVDLSVPHTFVYLNKKHEGQPYGFVPAFRVDFDEDENRDMKMRLKTRLIRLGYSVTLLKGLWYLDFEHRNSESLIVAAEIFLIFKAGEFIELQQQVISFGKEYGLELVGFASSFDAPCTLYGTNASYPGRDRELKLSVPLFTQDGELNGDISGIPFEIRNISTGKFGFDCTIDSYTQVILDRLLHEHDYVLKR